MPSPRHEGADGVGDAAQAGGPAGQSLQDASGRGGGSRGAAGLGGDRAGTHPGLTLEPFELHAPDGGLRGLASRFDLGGLRLGRRASEAGVHLNPPAHE